MCAECPFWHRAQAVEAERNLYAIIEDEPPLATDGAAPEEARRRREPPLAEREQHARRADQNDRQSDGAGLCEVAGDGRESAPVEC